MRHLDRDVTVVSGERDRPGAIGETPGLPETQSPQPHLGQSGVVQLVDVLGLAAVETQIPREGGHEQCRVVGRWECGRGTHLGIDRGGGQEQAPETQLLGLGVGSLDHPFGGEVAVLGQEHHGILEDDIAFSVSHRDSGRVAVTDEEHLGAIDFQRIVDAERVRAHGAIAVGDLHLGIELPGRPPLRLAAFEVHLERVQSDAEGWQGIPP